MHELCSYVFRGRKEEPSSSSQSMADTSCIPLPAPFPNSQVVDEAGDTDGSAERRANPKVLKNQKSPKSWEQATAARAGSEVGSSSFVGAKLEFSGDPHFGSIGGSLFWSIDPFIIQCLWSSYLRGMNYGGYKGRIKTFFTRVGNSRHTH